MFRPIRVWFLLAVVSLGLAACQVDLANPPRLATATAQSAAVLAAANERLALPAPTATPGAAVAATQEPVAPPGATLTMWVNETSPAHGELVQQAAADFADRYSVTVAIQQVAPALLPDLVNTGVLSGTLPDLLLHPLEYTAGWADRGILDGAAADEVVDALGRETFDPAALELLTTDGQIAAIPSDGYHQLLIYRQDWLDENDLDTPDDFAGMAAAAEALFNPEELVTGLIVPTESNLVTTHRAFEHMALANGCTLIDELGEIRLQDDNCREALEHYFTTINQFSPPGVQTDTSARNGYLAGQTALIITDPSILPDMAGLDPARLPTCDECTEPGYLAANSGIVTEITGDSPGASPTGFGNVTSLGITAAADREQAQLFARYWFDEVYPQWLAIESERKIPMRWGTTEDARLYIDAWGATPLTDDGRSLTDIYGDETVARLRDGVALAPRWGLAEGEGPLMTQLYEDLTISIVLQEMLSGYFDTTTTIREAYRRVAALIPNYAFTVDFDEEVTEE